MFSAAFSVFRSGGLFPFFSLVGLSLLVSPVYLRSWFSFVVSPCLLSLLCFLLPFCCAVFSDFSCGVAFPSFLLPFRCLWAFLVCHRVCNGFLPVSALVLLLVLVLLSPVFLVSSTLLHLWFSVDLCSTSVLLSWLIVVTHDVARWSRLCPVTLFL